MTFFRRYPQKRTSRNQSPFVLGKTNPKAIEGMESTPMPKYIQDQIEEILKKRGFLRDGKIVHVLTKRAEAAKSEEAGKSVQTFPTS